LPQKQNIIVKPDSVFLVAVPAFPVAFAGTPQHVTASAMLQHRSSSGLELFAFHRAFYLNLKSFAFSSSDCF
jgi:hypothetical protein